MAFLPKLLGNSTQEHLPSKLCLLQMFSLEPCFFVTFHLQQSCPRLKTHACFYNVFSFQSLTPLPSNRDRQLSLPFLAAVNTVGRESFTYLCCPPVGWLTSLPMFWLSLLCLISAMYFANKVEKSKVAAPTTADKNISQLMVLMHCDYLLSSNFVNEIITSPTCTALSSGSEGALILLRNSGRTKRCRLQWLLFSWTTAVLRWEEWNEKWEFSKLRNTKQSRGLWNHNKCDC